MLAWMNKESLIKTLETNNIYYWSRSRNKLWRKGETSGNFQSLVEFRFDCDKDCIFFLLIKLVELVILVDEIVFIMLYVTTS